MSIGYLVTDKQWKFGQVVKREDAGLINSVLWAKIDSIRRYLADCAIRGVRVNLDLAAQGKGFYSFCDYLNKRTTQYKNNRIVVMSQKLKRFVKELQECFKGDVSFDDLTPSTLRDF